jgi:hypothetical protein
VIERGHEHKMVPIDKVDRESGTRVIRLQCQAQPPTAANPTPCRMEEERVYRGEKLERIRIRIHGVWFHPFDLLRSLPLSVQECSVCGGEDWIEPCENCGGLGVEALGGGPLAAPDLHVAR